MTNRPQIPVPLANRYILAKLFVGGLQSANGGCLATEEQLTTYFKKWGNVVNFQLIKVCFVVYESQVVRLHEIDKNLIFARIQIFVDLKKGRYLYVTLYRKLF